MLYAIQEIRINNVWCPEEGFERLFLERSGYKVMHTITVDGVQMVRMSKPILVNYTGVVDDIPKTT